MNNLLHSQGSLTQKLESLAKQPLRVHVIHQGFVFPALEYRLLFAKQHKNPNSMMAWSRTTHLYGNDSAPWVLAHSLFLCSALVGDAKRLQFLGTTPIGYVLFKKQADLPYTRTFIAKNGQPARQTLYNWQGRLLLIEEIFLEALVQKYPAFI